MEMDWGLRAFWRDRQQRSLVLVIIASILEKADAAAVPAVYRELGLALHVSPSALGSFRLVQMLTQAVFAPFAGYLALRYKRTKLIAAGALISAVAAFSIGISTTLPQVALSIALSSLGVAVTWPAIQSLVADATDESNRGTTFGWLQLISHLGSLFGGVTAVLLAGTSVLGVTGWRVAFFLMSALSFLIAISLLLFADEPHDSRAADSNVTGGARAVVEVKTSAMEDLKEILGDARRILGVKTFQIIVAQGMVGAVGWSALSFSSMWLELTGFTHPQTASILGSYVLAGSLGGLFGGFMGDRLCNWFPDAGRLILGQVSTGIAVPLSTILLVVLPANASTPLLHGLVFFMMGYCMTWTAPGTNFPILAEIVPTKSRTNVYALEKGFISILGAWSPPIVGLLSEKYFGYVPVPKGANGNLVVRMDRENASALGKAMYASAGLSFLLCCLLFTPLYWAYPWDRDRVRDQLAAGQKGNGCVPLHDMEKNRYSIITEEEEEEEVEPAVDEKEELHIVLTEYTESDYRRPGR